jgi:hypothetical protein
MSLDLPQIDKDDYPEIYDDFHDRVNMQPKELEEWLETEESKSVGRKDGRDESIGHESGRRIVETKRTKKDDLTHEQYRHMKKVVNYIGRHSAQRPDGDIENTDWCYSLKNWGHDPTKD